MLLFLVPHIAPVSLNFIHQGTELWTGTTVPGGSKICSRSNYEDPTCSNSRGPLLFNALDHLTYFNMFAGSCDLASPIDEGYAFWGQFIITISKNGNSFSTSLPSCVLTNQYNT